MSILVTGGAGFIGSHIVNNFIENGYQVVVADNLNSGNKINLNSNAKFYNIDIKSSDLEKIFIENKIEYVAHYAAQASVAASMRNPLEDINENVVGTINLLNLCKKFGIKKIMVASTAAVYGMPEYLPVDEEHSTNYLSFYGLSKLTMENYVKLFGVDYIIFRFSNVYGPHQNAEGEAGVISIFLNKILSNKPVEIHGGGDQTRDFIYVEDVAIANILAVKSNVKNEIINISSNSQVSINELFDILKEITGYNTEISHTPARNGDIRDSMLDNRKAQKLLDWKNNIELREGLKQTTNFLKI
ncbi:MAG: hypothetical protein A2287_01355 [Candidatus Melainabacteria bacterium RIFOXYA12_FULL_32_12]|nr:MAG: hypothetical protein A2255_00700 [Candidatus Melainabacteria bacterium RIFOXYA2_FULL_32_9]OGI28307.1 MAG: hypothetical protein A2287_01355 [Candidatus Melainabacteria bacterium RIFOXYA12_FULL_32_12]